MAKGGPFIKFFPSDFLADTSGLSAAERGVFIILLCLMFEKDGPIVRDDKRLARRCGIPIRNFRRCLEALMEPDGPEASARIIEVNGTLTNERAEASINERLLRSQVGVQAATQRWASHQEKTEKNQGMPDVDASSTHIRKTCSSDASPESRVQNRESTTTTTTVPTNGPAHEATSPRAERGGGGPTHRDKLLEAMGVGWDGVTGPNGRMIGTEADMAIAKHWEGELGLSPDEQIDVVRECMATKADPGPPASFRYFTPAMRRLAAAKQAAPLSPTSGGRTSARQERADFDAALRSTIDALRAGEISFPD